MMGLTDGRKRFKIGLAGCDRQPRSHPASHVAVASTRYAYLRCAVKIRNFQYGESKIHNNVIALCKWRSVLSSGSIFLTENNLFNGVNVLAGAGRAFSVAAALPLCRTDCFSLSTAVSPVLNATIKHCNPYLFSIFFTRILSSLVKTIVTFHVIKKVKNITSLLSQVGWLNIAILEIFGFPVLTLNYLYFKNYLAIFFQNCKVYSIELLVNEINGIINSDKFSYSYDDLCFGVAFLRHRAGQRDCG